MTVPSRELADAVGALPDGVDLHVWQMDGPPPVAGRLDLVVPPYLTMSSALARLDGLDVGLVQGQAIGFEGIEQQLPPGSVFANAATVHETATAELAVTLALAAQRGIPAYVHAQDDREWTQGFTAGLADRRVLLLGYGGVGRAIAARLAPFELEVVPVASRARRVDGVAVHGIDELPALLPGADIVVAALPGGQATRHVMDAAALALLPDGALVVNVGRGTLVDTDALLVELEAGRLRAALDVVDPEPLPADHPLWAAPGLLLTPHVGGASDAMLPRIAALVRRQAAHLLAGEAPENVVLRT